MGRLFLIHLEGNTYTCKHCETQLAHARDVVSKGFVMDIRVNNDVSGRFCGENYFAQFVSETSFMCKHGNAYLFDNVNSFMCKHGKAYLFDNVVNVTVGEKEDRMMITGVHTVVDIFCVGCGSILGWKYEVAHDKSQKYKEGKFILERFKVLGPDGSSYSYTQEVQMAGNDADD